MKTMEEILKLAEELGVNVVEQKSFYKLTNGDKKALYVAKNKRVLTRIDVSGFTVTSPVVTPPTKKNGAVTGIIDPRKDGADEAIREAFTLLCDPSVEGKKATA